MSDHALFSRWRRDFLGLDPPGSLFPGRRIYLDAAATSLMSRPAWSAETDYLSSACANPHSEAHEGARASTGALERSRQLVGRLVGYDPMSDEALFIGRGATAAINRIAVALARHPLRHERPLVAVGHDEHHSNLLPWRRVAGQANLRFIPSRPEGGTLDLDALENLLARERGRIGIVAISGASNVTGAIHDVHGAAQIAHTHGARIVVDAAQLAPHVPLAMHPEGRPGQADLDAVALSGHKLWAPGSPGVLVAARELFRGCLHDVAGDAGGGAVVTVDESSHRLRIGLAEREEAGTANTPGAVALGTAAAIARRTGMDLVRAWDDRLVQHALERIPARVPGIVLYGDLDPLRTPRVGVVAFNLPELPHGLVARALDDYFRVAVRSGCLCAAPLVRSLVARGPEIAHHDVRSGIETRAGLVRASFGPWTEMEDVNALVESLAWIHAHADYLRGIYAPAGDPADGAWAPVAPDGSPAAPQPTGPCFSIDGLVSAYAAKAR